MSRFFRSIAVLALLLAPTSSVASTWQIDPAHTSAQFAVRHLMVATVRGTMGKVSGTLTLDETDPTRSTVSASIDATGIDTHEPKRDADLRSPEFLDVAQYPTVTFTSTKVEQISKDRFRVGGDLTLRGVKKPVILEVHGTPTSVRDPSGKTRLGGSVTTTINRQDFGVAWSKKLDAGGLVVGDDVDITIDVELIKAP